MKATKLEKRTAEIVSKMFYRNTFDVTLLDRYFEEKEVEISLLISIHKYICQNI